MSLALELAGGLRLALGFGEDVILAATPFDGAVPCDLLGPGCAVVLELAGGGMVDGVLVEVADAR